MYSWELLKRYFTLSSTRQSSFLTCGCFCVRSLILHKPFQNISTQLVTFATKKDSHNTGNFMPYSFRIVCGFFNVTCGHFKHGRYCETGPTVYSPYPRRLESLTNVITKGSTYFSVILRPRGPAGGELTTSRVTTLSYRCAIDQTLQRTSSCTN